MKKRNSNLELMRILSMFLIVLHHYSIHGMGTDLAYSINRYITAILVLGGQLGVVIFVLISGYYMCQINFSIKSQVTKIAKLVGQVIFYSIVFINVAYIISKNVLGYADILNNARVGFGIKQYLNAILPIGYSTYWFATDYIVLMICSPLLNVILKNIEKKRLKMYLLIFTFLWSVIPILTNAEYDYNNIVWFMVLYLYAGYIRLYVKLDEKYKRNLLIAISIYIVIILSAIIMTFVGNYTEIKMLTTFSNHFAITNSPFILLCGIELLLFFVKLKPYYSNIINIIASATFGVYLIHDNVYIRQFIWKYILGLPQSVYNKDYLIVHAFISVIIVYTICTLIELMRQYTIERVYMKIVNCTIERFKERSFKIVKKLYGLFDIFIK